MQALDRLQEAYGRKGLVVVAVEGEGVAAGAVLERVEKLRGIGILQRYVILPDPGGRIARQFRVESTPQTSGTPPASLIARTSSCWIHRLTT